LPGFGLANSTPKLSRKWLKIGQNIVVHILPITKHYSMTSFVTVLTALSAPENSYKIGTFQVQISR
jgi:hypothetical protein